MAFGFLHDLPDNLRVIILSTIALSAIAIICVMINLNSKEKKFENSALALILGGALGNLINRLYLGYVTDFLDFHLNYAHHFPAFNLADVAICLGVAGISYISVFQHPKELKSR